MSTGASRSVTNSVTAIWSGEESGVGTAGSQQKMPHVIRSRNSHKSIFLKTEVTTNQTCKSFTSGLGDQELRRLSEDLLLFITRAHTHTHPFALFDFLNYVHVWF